MTDNAADRGKDGKSYPLTAKQLEFIRLYLDLNGNASEAYRQAYPGSGKWPDNAVRVNASKLLDNPKVAAELNKRRAEASANIKLTAELLISRNLRRADMAEAAGQHAAAVAAETLAARLAGLLIDKIDQTVRNATPADHKPDLSQIRSKAQLRVVGGNTVPQPDPEPDP